MTVTVHISFQDALLEEIDTEARRESCSRSALLREAARMYIKRQHRLATVFAMGDAAQEKQGFTEKDIEAEIAACRGECPQHDRF